MSSWASISRNNCEASSDRTGGSFYGGDDLMGIIDHSVSLAAHGSRTLIRPRDRRRRPRAVEAYGTELLLSASLWLRPELLLS
jgi:hypothetical protein